MAAIKSDHHQEFDQQNFIKYYNEHRIVHNFVVCKTLVQEKKNRTLEDVAKIMIM